MIISMHFFHYKHCGWKSRKMSHFTLQTKRATFTFWVDKSSLKMPKNVQLASFWKPEVCGQTVLPDRFNILDYSLFVCGCLIDRNRPGGLISKSCRNCRWFPLLTVGGKAVHNLLTNERWSFGVASAFVELTDLVGGNRELLLLKQLGSK